MHEAGSQETKTLWVPMVDPEIVKQIRALAELGWGKKRIARELGVARNSVKRYLREGAAAETQTRPGAWDRALRFGYGKGASFSCERRKRTLLLLWALRQLLTSRRSRVAFRMLPPLPHDPSSPELDIPYTYA